MRAHTKLSVSKSVSVKFISTVMQTWLHKRNQKRFFYDAETSLLTEPSKNSLGC